MQAKFETKFAWRRFAVVLIAFMVTGISAWAETPVLLPAQEAKARKLYNLKCAKCHEFYDPGAYAEADWESWMKKMKKKAHLNSDDYDLLSRYTHAMREKEK